MRYPGNHLLQNTPWNQDTEKAQLYTVKLDNTKTFVDVEEYTYISLGL
jgi:hypothetical protein